MDQEPTPLTPSNPAVPAFDPVPLRARHDGWTPEKQLAFIEALAECACVEDAARRVGMSPQSAYTLRVREGAGAFRLAWRIALDHGVDALGDAAWSRALHGTVTPIFYRGEQVGERRHFDEKMTMFLLRHRDPVRYGKWIERAESAAPHPDADMMLTKVMNLLNDHLNGVKSTLAEHGLVYRDPDDEEEEEEEDDDDEAEDEADEDEGDYKDDEKEPEPLTPATIRERVERAAPPHIRNFGDVEYKSCDGSPRCAPEEKASTSSTSGLRFGQSPARRPACSRRPGLHEGAIAPLSRARAAPSP